MKTKAILFISILLCSCSDRSEEKAAYTEPVFPAYFDSIEVNDQKISLAGRVQTLKQFILSKPTKPSEGKHTIYIQPIGTFTPLQKKQIDLLKTYLQAFYQCPTKTLEAFSADSIPASARRFTGNDQLLAGYILDSVLKDRVPENGILILGISELDLYPKEEWMYVFGLASLTNKVAVSSIYRLQGYELADSNFKKCLSRFLKVSSHEAGHSFGLHHCVEARCVMNYSNSLIELDRSTVRLCSKCQRKIYSGFQYDSKRRNQELITFLRENDLSEELQSIEKDLRFSE